MRRFAIRSAFAIALAVMASGCASTGFFASANLTNVELASPNYVLVARDVSGAAEAGYLFGVSAAVGAEMKTVALARVSGTGTLYADAIADLWRNFEQANGTAVNRSLALANVRFDPKR